MMTSESKPIAGTRSVACGIPARSLYDIFMSRLQASPDRIQYRFIERSGNVRLLTLTTLWLRSSEIALRLRARGMGGQRVLLACGSQHHFVLSFSLACWPAPSQFRRRR